MKPLEGVKVLEFATYAAGPTAARLMAEWGAEVIKVESISGDPVRWTAKINLGAPDDISSQEHCFANDISNWNKKFVALNLRSTEGKKIFHKLLAQADIMVSNYRIQALESMGLTYEDLKDRYPALVYGHLTGYGDQGPEKDTPGFDYTCYGARGGVLGSFAQKGGEPINSVDTFGDMQGGMLLACGACVAYIGRLKSGKGSKVTTSLLNASVYANTWPISEAQFGKEFPRKRMEANIPFLNTYRAQDDSWMQLAIMQHDQLYNKIITLLGRPDLVDHPDYQSLPRLLEVGKKFELMRICEEQFALKPADEWVKIFKENDLTLEKAFTFNEMLTDPQLWENNYLRKYEYPNGREIVYVPGPIHFNDEAEYTQWTPSHVQGYDNDAVLAQLGYSQEQIDTYREKKHIK